MRGTIPVKGIPVHEYKRKLPIHVHNCLRHIVLNAERQEIVVMIEDFWVS